MRAIIQRVSSASVTVEGRLNGSIAKGLVVLLGIAPTDTAEDGAWLAQKIARLRIFSDDAGQMNRSVQDIQGGVLVVSQFTLFASTRKGTRPSFNEAAAPSHAKPLYELFLKQMESALAGNSVACGEFGALMQISLVNDGPVTLLIDTQQKE